MDFAKLLNAAMSTDVEARRAAEQQLHALRDGSPAHLVKLVADHMNTDNPTTKQMALILLKSSFSHASFRGASDDVWLSIAQMALQRITATGDANPVQIKRTCANLFATLLRVWPQSINHSGAWISQLVACVAPTNTTSDDATKQAVLAAFEYILESSDEHVERQFNTLLTVVIAIISQHINRNHGSRQVALAAMGVLLAGVSTPPMTTVFQRRDERNYIMVVIGHMASHTDDQIQILGFNIIEQCIVYHLRDMSDAMTELLRVICNCLSRPPPLESHQAAMLCLRSLYESEADHNDMVDKGGDDGDGGDAVPKLHYARDSKDVVLPLLFKQLQAWSEDDVWATSEQTLLALLQLCDDTLLPVLTAPPVLMTPLQSPLATPRHTIAAFMIIAALPVLKSSATLTASIHTLLPQMLTAITTSVSNPMVCVIGLRSLSNLLQRAHPSAFTSDLLQPIIAFILPHVSTANPTSDGSSSSVRPPGGKGGRPRASSTAMDDEDGDGDNDNNDGDGDGELMPLPSTWDGALCHQRATQALNVIHHWNVMMIRGEFVLPPSSSALWIQVMQTVVMFWDRLSQPSTAEVEHVLTALLDCLTPLIRAIPTTSGDLLGMRAEACMVITMRVHDMLHHEENAYHTVLLQHDEATIAAFRLLTTVVRMFQQPGLSSASSMAAGAKDGFAQVFRTALTFAKNGGLTMAVRMAAIVLMTAIIQWPSASASSSPPPPDIIGFATTAAPSVLLPPPTSTAAPTATTVGEEWTLPLELLSRLSDGTDYDDESYQSVCRLLRALWRYGEITRDTMVQFSHAMMTKLLTLLKNAEAIRWCKLWLVQLLADYATIVTTRFDHRLLEPYAPSIITVLNQAVRVDPSGIDDDEDTMEYMMELRAKVLSVYGEWLIALAPLSLPTVMPSLVATHLPDIIRQTLQIFDESKLGKYKPKTDGKVKDDEKKQLIHDATDRSEDHSMKYIMNHLWCSVVTCTIGMITYINGEPKERLTPLAGWLTSLMDRDWMDRLIARASPAITLVMKQQASQPNPTHDILPLAPTIHSIAQLQALRTALATTVATTSTSTTIPTATT